ncbi:E3 ubiquitin-protein ligase TRIM69 [Rhea pennata]|uniref:E3 ubiquitin-protein ligase TRIM69 n=1 Tax=Rhea pennata TaxID=8795 RepID=UPI002E275BC9
MSLSTAVDFHLPVSVCETESLSDLTPELPGDLFGKDLSCTICLKWFKEPVILPCGHNFCKPCIQNIWVKTAVCACPECRAEAPGGQYIENTVLGKVLESLKGFQVEQCERTCSEHGKPLVFFRKPDGKLACFLCRESHVSEDQIGQFLLVPDAVRHYVENLILIRTRVESTLQKLKILWHRQKEQIASHQENRLLLQHHISLEFLKLHQFLHGREKKLMNELQEEGKTFLQDMQLNMDVLQEKCNQAKEILTDIQSRLYHHNSISFLTGIKSFMNSLQEKAHTLSEGQLVCRELSPGQFRGPIQYTAWKEMKSILSPGLSLITLDPKTAHPNLVLSADLTSVRHDDVKQMLPNTPERFDSSIAVLGAEGFTSGKHYWEVEVEKKTKWTLGVVKGSISRKKKHPLSPREGYWLIMLRNRNELKALDVPTKGLILGTGISKIGVYLDYEGGQVSFYEANEMSHIYTFRDTFTEKLYPYFCPCLNEAGTNSDPLKVVSSKI